MNTPATNRRLGGAFALVASVLIAAQPPFASAAAQRFSVVQFLFLTQIGLLVSLPLLLATRDTRRDFAAALGAPSNAIKLFAIFAVSTAGLLLYAVSLSHAHPVVVVAILNLGPFWAALVAWVATRTPIPVSPAVFFACLAVAFLGAIAVAWSQAGDHAGLVAELVKGTWAFAIPIPLFTALSGSLTGKWFAELSASGAVAANILVGNIVLIPATLVLMHARGEHVFSALLPTLLLIVGIILADAVGRVFYQKALNVTGGDNGFVTMFQNIEPAVAALISLALSPWIKSLHFSASWPFFAGLALTGAGLSYFSWQSLGRPSEQASGAGAASARGSLTSRLDS